MHTTTGERVDFIERFYRLDVGNDCPVHIAAATLMPDQWGVRRVASGRGLSADDALGRCLSEAVERQSAVYNDTSEIIQSSFRDLGPTVIDPRLLLQFSDTQYANRMAWNAHVEIAHQIPQRFDGMQKIGWVGSYSLASQSTMFVPAAYCFLGNPWSHDEGFPIPDSSGLAAGATLNDAIERGLLELIERDAVAIWWYNRLAKPHLAFDSAKLALWAPYADWIKRCGRRFWLLDLTTDLGVPVAAAVSCDQSGSDLSFGFAAGKSPALAAENALCEMVQFEVTKKYHKPRAPGTNPHFLSWCQSANTSDDSFVAPTEPKREVLNPQLFSVDTIVDRLAQKGLEAFAFEFPSASEPTKVVRAIVPGLRSIWPRFAAGRLYDVPCDLGWVERPRQEAELNPVPILY